MMDTMNIDTGNTEINEKLITLTKAIQAIDMSATREALETLYESSLSSKELAKWITQPVNITYIHSLLIEHFGIPMRAMQLKNRVPHLQRRAMLFFKGMLNGLKRVELK